jgi:uncharacterized protein (TIGR00252 family)
MKKTNSGICAEEKVANYLLNHGYEVIARNWKTPQCEVDIIAKKDNCLYFVEVKYRKTSLQGSGFEYITPKKMKQMSFAASYWIARHGWEGEVVLSGASVSGVDFAIEFIEQL